MRFVTGLCKRSGMSETQVHVPVLLEAVLALLDPKPGQRIIDATIDGGGHAAALLERIGPDGALLGIERDPEITAAARTRLADSLASGRLVVAHGNFRDLQHIAAEHGFGRADAVLFDLGLSSFHFDRSGRGFSFQHDEPLDMRFDPSDVESETAADILASRSAAELTELFRDYGEERFASRIARSVVAARQRVPVETTTQVLEIITRVLPGKERQRAGRSAARIFQALRIVVNRELEAVRQALPQAVALLAPGGRLAVIAFHSLEDRMVKHFFRDQQRAGQLSVLTKRPIRPADGEIIDNPRAASAKLRVAERISPTPIPQSPSPIS